MDHTPWALTIQIAASPTFRSAPRLASLLQYLAKAQECGTIVKEYAIGVDVLERPPDFDPRIDSIVRVHISRLRKRLIDYYANEGRTDDIQLALPKGEYRFHLQPRHVNEQATPPVEVQAETESDAEASPIDASEFPQEVPARAQENVVQQPPSHSVVARVIPKGIIAGIAFSLAVVIVAGYFLWPRPIESAVIYIGADAQTRGNWTQTYGADGLIIPNLINNPPPYAKVEISGSTTFTWWSHTKDLRALQRARGSTDRFASLFHTVSEGTSAFSIKMNLTDGKLHRVALYLCDWDSSQRYQSIVVSDTVTNRLLDTRAFHEFQNGLWAVWNIKGNISFEIRGVNVRSAHSSGAAVNGIFFGDGPRGGSAAGGLGPATVTWSNVQTRAPGAYTIPGAAKYVGDDTTTQGSWKGSYGAEGQLIANNVNDPPPYAIVTLPDTSTETWVAAAADRRALQSARETSRIASRYLPRAPSRAAFAKVEITDTNTHRIALYMCDWDHAGRVQNILLRDAATSRLLESRRYVDLANGRWSIWNISGGVLIELRSENAIPPALNGIFFQ